MVKTLHRCPTELELEILKVVWREGTVSVRQVRDALAATRDLAYNTVLTMMTIMTRKGHLKRSAKTKGLYHVYKAAVPQARTYHAMLHDMVDRVFSGSAFDAAINLLQSENLTQDELKQLHALMNGKGKEAKS